MLDVRVYSAWSDVHGPTFHLAWKLATLAMQAMERKLKNTCEMWNMMAGFETII